MRYLHIDVHFYCTCPLFSRMSTPTLRRAFDTLHLSKLRRQFPLSETGLHNGFAFSFGCAAQVILLKMKLVSVISCKNGHLLLLAP